ncbi:hypothetical protein MTR67_043640 [Solanum verrucosum]|uniref:Uncharacterized protein n=1 Tax=Solanum verrucosum TaxID=315347 RepID=A0AAF0ZUX0_SOLVR|nr:hypothetical protein MTR67_043640 [Solanum verrucosum]
MWVLLIGRSLRPLFLIGSFPLRCWNLRELVRDVHRLARLGVLLVYSTKGGIMVHNGSKSFFVADVKAKQGLNPILVELEEAVLKKSVKAFSQGEMVYLEIKVVYVFQMLMT